MKKKHVLDSRGYALCSKISFEFESNFKTTLPSRSYPSASPYAALTEYLREMMREKILTRFIVKALLYPEFLSDIDTTEVKLRKRHKTFVRMYRRERGENENESSECDDDDEDDEEELDGMERQNAIDIYESDRSHIYSNVKYKTGKRDSWEDDERTIYESFIDHGEGAGEIYYQRLHDDSNSSSLCFVTELDTRESFMIGSKPTRYVDDGKRKKKKDLDDTIVHLTTAKMNLLDIKQKSEQSQMSSFEHKLSGGGGWKNMACEDLLNIDETMKVLNSTPQKPFTERHHSMPVQFVGNRFNENSLTEIYIPSCDNNANNDKQIATPYNSVDDNDENNEKHSHSSSVRVQESQEHQLESSEERIKNEIAYNLEKFEEMPGDLPLMISQPAVTIYSSDSDSGMAGSYTLSPSDNCHRSYNSQKFNQNVTPSWTLRDTLNRNESLIEFLPYTHEDSVEGENHSKIMITLEHDVMKKTDSDEKKKEIVFYSGMYAHWWKKETLPEEMMKSLLKTFVHDGGGKRIEGEGSGKQNTLENQQNDLLRIHINDVAHKLIVRGVPYFFI